MCQSISLWLAFEVQMYKSLFYMNERKFNAIMYKYEIQRKKKETNNQRSI